MNEYKYAVFSDYCDAGVVLFKTYEEAEKEFNERINDEDSNGVDAYLVEVKKGYKADKEWIK